MRIPVARPSLNGDEIARIRKVFATGWLGMGSVVCEFEKALQEYLGAEYVVAVNTGTSALHIALDSFGIGKGDEVIVPSLTFVATPHAVLMCDAKVVFCDINEDTLNANADDIRRKITRNTRAIIPVHYSGFPCDMDAILTLAKNKGLHVIEDAAHAFGSIYKGRKIGSFGDATCFSFDPIKVITCGEGGAIATNDSALAKKMLRKRILGIDKDTYSRYKHTRNWFYQVRELGYRYHMSNINAAIGLAQLGKIDTFLKRRREISSSYDRMLSGLKEIKIIKKVNYRDIAPFNYIIKVKNSRREALMKFLKDKGVETGVHYIPNHTQPFYKKSKTSLPVTEKVAGEILTLPLYYDMSDSEVEKIAKLIKTFMSKRG